MSLQATLDLCIKASPRSLCVFDAHHAEGSSGKSNNPFDNPIPSVENAMAVITGTERGTLHFRTYQTAHRSSAATGALSAASMMGAAAAAATSGAGSKSSSSLGGGGAAAAAAGKPQTPLGLSTTSGRAAATAAASTLPRAYFPVDLTSLPGAVVACVPLLGTQKAPSSGGTSSSTAPYFLLLLDDNRGSSANSPGQYACMTVTLTGGSFHVCSASRLPKRISCAVFHPVTGLVYGAGRSIVSVGPDAWQEDAVVVVKKRSGTTTTTTSSSSRYARWKHLVFSNIPGPGVRGGQDAMALTAAGRVAVVAVGNSFYAVAGQEVDERQQQHHRQHSLTSSFAPDSVVKILSFTQSSQVHPVIILDLQDKTLDADWSSLFLANGRECAAVDLNYGPPSAPSISCSSKPRYGTVSLPSPILAAAASSSWVVILPSDGMVSVRSPSCLAVALRTIEVGQRPNDYFVLRTLCDETQPAPWVVALAYSGECKVLQCQRDTAQDLADRLMRLAIDAFGANGFPRSELAEAVNASFTATSYVGPEPTPQARSLLTQYLSAVLELADFESGGRSGWPTELAPGDSHHGTFGEGGKKESFSGRGSPPTMLSSASPAHLMTGSALLCLTCSQLSPPSSGLASRAAKACAMKLGIVFRSDVPNTAAQVCELVAEKLLREISSNFSLITGSSPAPISHIQRGSNSGSTDFVEACIWLLRSAGKHERAIEVAHERLLQHGQVDNGATGGIRGTWSRIKFESYMATHLSEIWSSGKEEGYSLVLRSPATFRLLENNPRMGLSVFTISHPQNESQWRSMPAREDPLAQPKFVYEVLKVLKVINPVLPYDKENKAVVSHDADDHLPLESGRALAVAFLESATGINTDRPTYRDEFYSLPADESSAEHIANFHDELAFLLLEGVIAERDDSAEGEDTDLGKIYRGKLRQFLKWPLAKIRPERFMETLPSTFLQEKALMLGRIGRHEDALRILYRDLNSLDLALEYCDDRYERQRSQQEKRVTQPQWGGGTDMSDISVPKEDNAYLPLVRVALDSEDKERGITAAIQVLALRRSAIDRAAALRLLPAGVPVSAVARPFLIPALVDSESQVRRLTVVSSLLRARYLRLQDELTVAQLKAQSNLHVVPQLRSVDLGDLLHSTKAFRVRTSTQASSTMPDLMVVKHFFPRHLVIQAKVTNTTGSSAGPSDFSFSGGINSNKLGRVLTDIAFVVAESSEEAIQPLLQVPIKVLPPKLTGSAWCVLDADPAHMDGSTAQMTCELRYTVQPVDGGGGNRNAVGIMSSSATTSMGGRTFVEELQDLEVHAAHFS